VNLGALDALVLDYVESELLVENSDATTISSASSNVNVRMVIHLIRTLMQSGHIMEAFKLMQEHAPVVLEDQRLLFQLHKQNFIELVRNSDKDCFAEALEYARTHLCPCALNAYPEAYEEFKGVLLALMYDKDDTTSPVSEEVSLFPFYIVYKRKTQVSTVLSYMLLLMVPEQVRDAHFCSHC
jgi:hypothetical protein